MGVKLKSTYNMKAKRLLSLLSVLPLISCTSNFVLESKVFYFDTLVEIKMYQGSKSDLNYIKSLIKDVDALSDNYHQRDVNNVYTLNHTNDIVTVDPTLYNLLQTSVNVSNQGATYFNPLCGSLSQLWKDSLANKEVPSEESVNSELSKITSSEIEFLEDNQVKRVGEATIDLGGIAKGYTLDLIHEYLNSKNYKQYLVNAGSSSILLGEKNADSGYFTVGIRDLSKAYLKLKNCVVSTSSKSVQGVTIDGTTYSHIINPVTGSAINLNDAVIVVSDSGYLGDALSTSMMMNTIEEIQQIEEEFNVKTIVIRGGQKIYSNKDLKVQYH